MKLESLHIRQLPGIHPGFHLEGLDPRINLLLGPNASGKSSVVRALRHLMETRTDDPANLVLSATFSEGERQWQVDRLGRDIHWRCDGEPCAPPPLPGAEGLGYYWIGLDRLLETTREDQAAEATLRREMQGGYDLQALRESQPFSLSAQRGRIAARELQQRQQTLRRVEREHQALASDEARLPELSEAVAEAQRARERRQACEQALLALDAARELRHQEDRLARYPDPMPVGLTRDRLETLEQQEAELARALASARDDQARAEADRQATGLADGGPPPAELQAAGEQARRLTRLEEQVRHTHEQLAATRRAAAQAARALGRGPDDDRAQPALSPEELAGLERLAHEAHAARERLQALDARLATLEPNAEPFDPAPLERGCHELRRWLRQPAPRPLHWLGLGLTGLGGAGTAALGLTLGHWPTVASSLVVLAGLGASAVAMGRRRDRRESETRFTELPLPAPEVWEEAAVRQRLDELEQAWHQARSLQQRRQEADQLHAQRGRARTEQAEAEQALHRHAAALGLDAELPLAFDRAVRLLSRHQEAREQQAAQEAVLDRQAQELDTLRDTLHHFLATWHTAPREERSEALGAALDDLRQRCEAAERARQQADNATRLIRELERQLRDTRRQLDQLYHDAGLQPDQRATLLERIDQLPEWQACRQALEAARSNYRLRREDLEGQADPDIIEWLEAGDEPALRRAAEDAAEAAGRLEPLREERAGIRTRLEQTRQRHDLEEALAQREEAREALAGEREQALSAAAARFLLERVARRHEQAHRPEALARADRLFARFTHQRYGLRLGPDQRLQAMDHHSEQPQPLERLSTGTRMQLLIALRVAWLEQLERQTRPLPLILDEALTTTDPERFQAVAGSLAALLETGRQIFYLSAQPEDARRWELALGQRPHCIELAQLRGTGSALSDQALQLPEAEPVPAPDGHTAESYARALQVPGIDPWRPAGEIHLFHLLRDRLDTLHRLLRDYRVHHSGELQRLLEDPALKHHLPAELREQLSRRVQLAHHWLQAWRQGRGRPVTRAVLEASGAVSDTFMPRVAELNDAHHGDARALLEALGAGEVSGFRRAKLEELESYLEAEGHLDPQPRLERDERYRTALAKVELPLEAVGRDAKIIDWLEAALLV
ncbi:hypothetical protein [Alkalilimnicola ehrlichii]|uniref:hypothetical protein n=1 Tax=Alkalilimnicola ehrlichii TaxID=351052 RepID=UPI003BA13B64